MFGLIYLTIVGLGTLVGRGIGFIAALIIVATIGLFVEPKFSGENHEPGYFDRHAVNTHEVVISEDKK